MISPYKVAHSPSGELILLPLPVGAGVLSLHKRVVMSTPPVFLFALATVQYCIVSDGNSNLNLLQSQIRLVLLSTVISSLT